MRTRSRLGASLTLLGLLVVACGGPTLPLPGSTGGEQATLPGCAGAHGVQVDQPERRRVFVACEGNARLVVLDLATRKVSVAVDPVTHVVYLPLTDVGGHPVLRELVA